MKIEITKEQARKLKFIFDEHYSNALSIVKAEFGFSNEQFEQLKTAYHETDGWRKELHTPKKRLGHQKNRLKASGVLVDMEAKNIAIPLNYNPSEKDEKDLQVLQQNGFTIQTSII